MSGWRRNSLLLLLASLALLPMAVGSQDEPAAAATEAAQAPAETPEPEAGKINERLLELEAREAALRLLEEDLATQVEELNELRDAAIAALLPQEEARAAELETLIKFYQAMKPKQAAKLLEKLPAKLAADVLSAMKSRSAGKILDVMNADRAVVISRLMAGRN